MTTTALAPAEAVRFTAEQVDLIKRQIAVGATDDELALFLAQCKRTGLDPFTRQIYFIKRKQYSKAAGTYVEVGRAETSIDGFRVIAERTGEMDGSQTFWCGLDGAWVDVWLHEDPPAAAKVVIHRKGCAHGFETTARWTEYVVTDRDGKVTASWRRMPALMLGKCCESLALRKAFPHQLSGLYTAEEMAQSERADAAPPPVPPPVTTPLKQLPEDGKVRLVEVRPKMKGRSMEAEVTFSTGLIVTAKGEQLVKVCEQFVQDGVPVKGEVRNKTNKKTGDTVSSELLSIHAEVDAPAPPVPATPPAPEPTADDIPF